MVLAGGFAGSPEMAGEEDEEPVSFCVDTYGGFVGSPEVPGACDEFMNNPGILENEVP
jgi:hypothetical protein